MSFGLARGNSGLLFCEVDWHSVERGQLEALRADVDGYNPDALLNTSPDDLGSYFIEKFEIEVPELLVDQLTVDQRETSFEKEDYGRIIRVQGTLIEVEVPFSGEGDAFKIQPTTYSLNPPRASVRGQMLSFGIEGNGLDAEEVRKRIDANLAQINENLERLRSSAIGLNAQLRTSALERIEQRRTKLLSDRNLVADLGLPLKSRARQQATYAAPEVKKKIAPKPPTPSKDPFKPEPALTESDYQNILGILERMVEVMECSPRDFANMQEETLRSHFLVQLNAQYEGNATGETFNYEGKTDILVKSNGRNIFIAECKFWHGAKKHTETIDQLLGYLSWRDTKSAIVIFNKNKNFSKMLEELKRATIEHPQCKERLNTRSETGWTYRFAHRDDPNRQMLVTVLAFDVPDIGAE